MQPVWDKSNPLDNTSFKIKEEHKNMSKSSIKHRIEIIPADEIITRVAYKAIADINESINWSSADHIAIPAVKEGNILFAKIDNVIRGYIAFTKFHDRFYVKFIAIDKSDHSKGVGSALMQELINKTREQGIKILFLVHGDHKHLHNFYLGKVPQLRGIVAGKQTIDPLSSSVSPQFHVVYHLLPLKNEITSQAPKISSSAKAVEEIALERLK